MSEREFNDVKAAAEIYRDLPPTSAASRTVTPRQSRRPAAPHRRRRCPHKQDRRRFETTEKVIGILTTPLGSGTIGA